MRQPAAGPPQSRVMVGDTSVSAGCSTRAWSSSRFEVRLGFTSELYQLLTVFSK